LSPKTAANIPDHRRVAPHENFESRRGKKGRSLLEGENRPLRCHSRNQKAATDSIHPILNLQAWYLTKMIDVARDPCRSARQRYASDQQVGASGLLEFFDLAKTVEFGSGLGVDGKNLHVHQHFFARIEQLLGAQGDIRDVQGFWSNPV